MQQIYIQNRRDFILEGHILPYDCYFIDSPSYNSVGSTAETFKLVLSRWASALSRKRKDGQSFIFPFAPDDEWTEALKGTIDGNSIILTRVILNVPGYGIDFESLEDFIISPKALFSDDSTLSELIDDVEESKSLKLIVDVDEFIEKLKNARVIGKDGDHPAN